MKFTVLSLFPELIQSWKQAALVEDAIEKKLLSVDVVNPRDYSTNKHKNVDDRVYGGEDGMVMMAEPLALAIEDIAQKQNSDLKSISAKSVAKPYVVALTPQGKLWQQSDVKRFLELENVVLVCGRYAGFDQRFLNEFVQEEISVGDYILNGGEVAALAVMESVSRFIPGFLGHEKSAVKDSFSEGPFLEAPSFTRPQEWRNISVPAFLLSGNHGERELWLNAISLVQTKKKRPDIAKFWSSQQQQDYEKAFKKLQNLTEKELEALGLKDFVNG